ncbi:hypothetical protein [Hydrogenophaga sp. RWCD_12]|uniref:hypothetical protein n=1 Tax=Hydrogenophaga sp. RWCD_12 TaxID=3391190 RepID=UPI00398562A2
MSTSKLSRLSGWEYSPTDVLDVQARTLFCSPAVPTNELVVPQHVPSAGMTSSHELEENTSIVSPFGGARIEPDVYCAADNYRGVSLRYVSEHRGGEWQGTVRVYVESPINYNGRNDSALVTHLWPANKDGTSHPPYLCFKAGNAPKTYEEAKKHAETWVRGNQHYIATGRDISSRIANGETI